MRIINIILVAFISIVLIIPMKSNGQKRIEKLINELTNSELRFEIAKVGTTRMVDSGVIALSKNLVFVTSVNLSSYSYADKKELIRHLVLILDDNNKDWYANVLLYQLTGREASVFIIIDNRKDWIKKYKDDDLKYWRSHLLLPVIYKE